MMTIKVGDKEYCIDGYSNISELQKVMIECYQQGRNDAIEEFKNSIQQYVDLYGKGKFDIEMNFNLFYEICSEIEGKLNEKTNG